MALDIFQSISYDSTTATYDLEGGIFKPTDVQGLTLEIGAEAEYYFAHGQRGPRGQTNSKVAPAGTFSQLVDSFDAMHKFLWAQGGSLLMGGVSEYPVTFTIHLNGARTMEIVLKGCRFYPQQLIDVGDAGSVTPIKTTCNIKFNAVVIME
jgi:hypothetical protein